MTTINPDRIARLSAPARICIALHARLQPRLLTELYDVGLDSDRLQHVGAELRRAGIPFRIGNLADHRDHIDRMMREIAGGWLP